MKNKKHTGFNLSPIRADRFARSVEQHESICKEFWFWTSYKGMPVPVFQVYR